MLDPMTTPQELTQGIVDSIATALGTHPEHDADSRELRLLAVLKPVLREMLERAARSIGSSQVRASAFVALAEDLYRVGGYGQILAAARAIDAQVHTITETPLAEVNELLAEPAPFLAGTRGLPADAASAPGRKPLYRDAAEYLKTQQNLTHFQALHRVETAANLLPRTGFNGKPVQPRFPRLGKVFSEATADPRAVSSLAKKLEGMLPEIDRQPEPEAIARQFESELAAAVRTRNPQGTARLLKDQARRLDSGVAAAAPDAESLFVGAYYLGHSNKGYEYRIITSAEGHELLATAADVLNNPTTAAGTMPGSPPRPPIPEWAVAPGTRPEQLPVGGFDEPSAIDTGSRTRLDPGLEVFPGETPDQARARQRARRLHQFMLDAIRIVATASGASRGAPGDPDGSEVGTDAAIQLPMMPHFTLAVTIDLATFQGQLEKAGITDHGQELSASACRRIGCNAGIIPVVLNGNGVPLELGRSRRYFNRAQRRAIAVRDKGCCNPGCSMPVNRTEAHHLDEWSEGGRTDVSRGCLLCVRCHVAYHAGHFRILMLKGLPHVIQPKSVDPLQLPRRNWIFHPACEPSTA